MYLLYKVSVGSQHVALAFTYIFTVSKIVKIVKIVWGDILEAISNVYVIE